MNIVLDEDLVGRNKAQVVGAGSSNGVCLKKFAPADSRSRRDLRAKYRLDPHDFVIAVVGRICVDKGILDFVKIATSLPAGVFKLLLVGTPDDDFSQATVSQLLVSCPDVRHVSHTDRVDEIFCVSDVHLFLSHREGFGNVAAEAAACGVPTIAYDVVGVRDSVAEGISGLRFPKGATDSIVACLIDAEGRRAAFADRFAGCREWVRDNFSREVVWSGYLSVYLNEARGRHGVF